MNTMIYHQNLMLALRVEIGWPTFKPANDCLSFSSGKEMDSEIGIEIARIAQMLNKDVIYSGWASTKAIKPTSFSLAYREVCRVDIVDKLVPYAANDTAPVTLVSPNTDEFFAIDRRGSLARVPGTPKGVGKGRQLAMKRIEARAAAMDDTLLANNRFVPPGQNWIEPDAILAETLVRFA